MTPVVIITSLKDFETELPPPARVRLGLTSKEKASEGPVYQEIMLNLQGINPQGEVVWLFYSQTATKGSAARDDYFPPSQATIMSGMREIVEHLRSYLTGKGYEVRAGHAQRGLAENVKPVRGVLEPVRWHKQADGGYRVTWEVENAG